MPASPVVLVEGVSASRRELGDLLDVAIWVDGDIAEQERRGVMRDGGDEAAQRFWDEWQAAERPLLDADRPWDRADLLVLGTPGEAGRTGHLVGSLGSRRTSGSLSDGAREASSALC